MALSDDVAKMRGITRATSTVNQFQASHLLGWFLTLSPHIKKENLKLTLDFDNRVVQYAVAKKGFTPFKYRKSLDLLSSWVQFLIGADWRVEVIYPKKVYYTSNDVKEVKRTEEEMIKSVQRQVG